MDIYAKPCIVAEIACNHMGNMDIAKEMIRVASSECHITVVKFQKRCIRELLTEEQYNAPHPCPANSFGKSYGEHREVLEFSVDQHIELMECCKQHNVLYSASVWDLTSAVEIASLNPQYIKIPSASNTNYQMLEWLCRNYKGEIHVSVGMTTIQEEKEIIKLFTKLKRNKDLVLYACTSGYPVPYEEMCMLEIKRLKESYHGIIKMIGYSGHHIGCNLDVAAIALGAGIIERHFTLDKEWKGTDHKASLLPNEIKQLVDDVDMLHRALTYKNKRILPIEETQRRKLKYIRNG